MPKKRKAEATHSVEQNQQRSVRQRRQHRATVTAEEEIVNTEDDNQLVENQAESVTAAVQNDHDYEATAVGVNLDEYYQDEEEINNDNEDDDDHNEEYNEDYDFYRNLTDELKCSICLSHLANPRILANCGHVFCDQCIRNWRYIGIGRRFQASFQSASNNSRRRFCPVCSKYIGKIIKCNVLQNICELLAEYWPHDNDNDNGGGGQSRSQNEIGDNLNNYNYNEQEMNTREDDEDDDEEATEDATEQVDEDVEVDEEEETEEDTTIVTIHVDVRSL